jgi:hypothetical protein
MFFTFMFSYHQVSLNHLTDDSHCGYITKLGEKNPSIHYEVVCIIDGGVEVLEVPCEDGEWHIE